MTEIETLKDDNFKDNIAKGLSIVDFYADWCGPCRMQSPIFSDASKDMPKARFFKLNVDENQETAAEYDIVSLPTILIFKNGEKVESLVGLRQKSNILEALKAHLD